MPLTGLAILLYCCIRGGADEIRKDDAETLRRMVPRNCVVLERHDKAQRRLRSQIKKLFKRRWHHKEYSTDVFNVGMVTNVSLRQRYERAYQTTQSAAPPSYLEAVNMTHGPSHHDVQQTTVVPLETGFEPGVLRQGEMYLFYRTNKFQLKTILESEAEPDFLLTAPTILTLEEFSSYGEQNIHTRTKYMFVVRAIIGADTVIQEPYPKNKRVGRTYRKSILSEVLPEFLVSYQVNERLMHNLDNYSGVGYVGGGGC